MVVYVVNENLVVHNILEINENLEEHDNILERLNENLVVHGQHIG